MKKVLLGAVGLIAMATSASAADMAARPYTKAPPMVVAMYNWSGLYVGANGGWGSSRKCWDITNFVGIAINPSLTEGCHDASGGTVGGQIGYRWQASSWVFGLEAQGNWADFKGSNVSLQLPNSRNESKIDAFGLFTGQVGYAWNNALLYVKGGAAVVSDKYTGSTVFPGAVPVGTAFDSARETRWGATLGVGMEYGFTPNWTFGIEYNHLFMGNRDITMASTGVIAPAGTLVRIDRINQDVDMVTARVNYKFGGPVVARY